MSPSLPPVAQDVCLVVYANLPAEKRHLTATQKVRIIRCQVASAAPVDDFWKCNFR